MATSIPETDTGLGSAYARLVAEYEARTPASRAHHERASRYMPGGDTRTVAYHAPYPLSIQAGRGYELLDVDGNRYVDFVNNHTSLIHGHAHPGVIAAVTNQLPKGTNYATAIESQVVLAELMCERVASVDLIRFTNSGTEATMNAVRAARAFTGRELIVKIEGGYHGTYDDFEVSVHPDPAAAGDDDNAPIPTLDAKGIVRSTMESVAVIPFNAIEPAERLFAQRGNEIAAVIVEPVMGSAGLIPAETSFLQALRDLTSAAGSLLILDEVMSFRLAYGGTQSVHGVLPDLTSFAKIIGGGFPVGAFGGREEIMAMFDPSKPGSMSQSGTFNGNAMTMVAGAAAMEAYPQTEVERINLLGATLRAGMQETLDERLVTATVTGEGSFAAVHFNEGPVRNYRDAMRGNQSAKKALHIALLLEGLFSSSSLRFAVSTPMDEDTIDQSIRQFGRGLDRLLAGG